ncbi:MAG: isoaspartyl peptidase/L-asparaginase [Kofleriaceae bacterium]|nr:isoaspartyl peptidase/L-asparaginase [Kofleriaceae bacterium]
MIVVHGGAGLVSPDRHERLRAGVRAAVAAAHALLARGAGALDAAVAAVRLLEDDPELGAGLGSALTRDGTVETCASVMDGATRRTGAVAAVPDLAARVVVARAMLERGEHVLLAGQAAARFATEIGLPPAAPGALVTARAHEQLREWHARAGAPGPGGEGGGVGAVVRDAAGNFAAATSTGGAIYRRAGSVDDSAVPGVGTWADGNLAVSTSGGEAAFRVALAHNIARRVADGESLRAAAKDVLIELRKLAPDTVAGAIMVGKNSWAALQLGPTMPVAWLDSAGPGDAIGFAL